MLTNAQAKQIAKEMFVLGTYDEFSLATILDLLKYADDAYFNDAEDITVLEDSQYDALKQYAQRLAPTDVYFTGVGSGVRGGKIKLPYTMGSLNQVYQGDYAKWVDTNKLNSEALVISDKLDGASNMMLYGADGKLQIAYSRGDGMMGADITRHISQIHNVPTEINNGGVPITIRAETIIAPASFDEMKGFAQPIGRRNYKNPRNMVAGMMNSSEIDPRAYKYIDVIAYEIVGSTLSKTDQLTLLADLGFSVVHYSIVFAGLTSETDLTEHLIRRRKFSPYEIDGVVIDIDSAEIRRNMRTDDLNPEYAIKYKVADASNFATATVKQVEWNISKDGYYKPRVQIHPIDLVGVTIQNLTGFNAKFIRDSRIGPGAKIQITRSGDVIPFILGVTEGVDPQMPDDEDAVWTDTGVDLVVADANANETVQFERLNDFFASVDVPHLGDGNLMKMFERGFDTPEKILVLTQEDIGSLVGSVAIGKKIFKGMREKFTNIPLYVLMGSHHAFGRGVGVRKMKKLYEAFGGDMSKCASMNQIIAVEGFEEKTAKKIQAGHEPFLDFLREVKDIVTIAPYVAKKQGHLSGKTFAFTGFRSKDLEDKIVEAGGTMGSTVSSKTTYLVTAEPNSTSGKAVKARDLGVTVIGQDELKAMV